MDIRTAAGGGPARIAALVVCVAALAVPAYSTGPVDPPATLDIRTAPNTGRAAFVTAAGGGPINVSPHQGRTSPQPEDFLRQYGHLFGIDNPAAQLVTARTETDTIGHTHTTYHQVHQGVPVFAGVVKVHQDPAGRIIAANGDFLPVSPKLSTTPAIDAATAGDIAKAAMPAGQPVVEQARLVIVDPGWYGDQSIGPHLAYHLVVTDADTWSHEGFFVDAHSGAVLDRWSMVCAALDRSIHDAAGAPDLPGPLARAEGDPPVADSDVNAAYDYAGDTYEYYWHAFGRDGLDDNGMTIVITVHTGAINCPNASWSFTRHQVAFCTGTVSDDIVAHELTHGVTEFTANLMYQNQSGQLNESFSDVFGELVDLFNGGAEFVGVLGSPPYWSSHPTGPGTDVPNNLRTTCSLAPDYDNGVRWLIAEDTTGWSEAIRDMWAPTCKGHPDRSYSPLQTCSLGDNGGVHSGSGIPNHAFAMLCDGAGFNGYTINAIGPIKAGAVWYRALTVYLTVASDFQDAYAAFNQAATDLVGTYPADPRTGLPSDNMFTAADAAEVDNALLAVEMNGPGACGQTVPLLDPDPPPQCAAPVAIFADDFEGGVNGWTVFNSGPPTPYDWVQTTNPLPATRAGAAWFCDDPNLGDCSTSGVQEMGTHSLVSPVINIPTGVHLPRIVFTQYLETENRYDGGVVFVRVNSGQWQQIPAAAFLYNSYNTTLFTEGQGNTNPYASQLTFSGADGQWSTSVVDLGTYVSDGDALEVRFDFSKDWCYGITGWFIDDFAVYHCPASPDCNSNGVADELDLAGGPHRDAFVVQPPNHSSGNPSDLDNGGLGVTALADNIILLKPQTIEAVRLWGGYYPASSAPPDHFTVRFHEDDAGLPGALLAQRADVPSTRTLTGETFLYMDEWEFTLTFDEPVTLDAGTYFVEILNDTTGSSDTFIWQRATVGHILGAAYAFEAPGTTWAYESLINFSMEVYGPVVGSDCNTNSLPDECDPWGDHNGDAAADHSDHAALAGCLTGPTGSAAGGCTCLLDTDQDGDIDLYDYAAFQRAFGG